MSCIIFVYIFICRIDIYMCVYSVHIYIYAFLGYSLVVASVSNSGCFISFSGPSLTQFLLDMCGWWMVAPCVLTMFSLSDKIGM